VLEIKGKSDVPLCKSVLMTQKEARSRGTLALFKMPESEKARSKKVCTSPVWKKHILPHPRPRLRYGDGREQPVRSRIYVQLQFGTAASRSGAPFHTQSLQSTRTCTRPGNSHVNQMQSKREGAGFLAPRLAKFALDEALNTQMQLDGTRWSKTTIFVVPKTTFMRLSVKSTKAR